MVAAAVVILAALAMCWRITSLEQRTHILDEQVSELQDTVARIRGRQSLR